MSASASVRAAAARAKDVFSPDFLLPERRESAQFWALTAKVELI